jgi:hypothetical protein
VLNQHINIEAGAMTHFLKLVSLAVVTLSVSVGGCAADSDSSEAPNIGTSTNSTTPVGVPAEIPADRVVQQTNLPVLAREPRYWETVQSDVNRENPRAALEGEQPPAVADWPY